MNRAYTLDALTKYRRAPDNYSVDDGPLAVDILTLNLTAGENPEDGFGSLQCFKRKLTDGRTVLVPWPLDFEKLSDRERSHWAAFEITNPEYAAPDDDPTYVKSVRQYVLGQEIDLPESE